MIYNIDENHLIIAYADGTTAKVCGSLIRYWAYESQWTTIQDILQSDSMVENMKDVNDFKLINAIGDVHHHHIHDIEKIINLERIFNIFKV